MDAGTAAMDGQAHAHVEHPADGLQVLRCDTFAAITRRSSQHYKCMEHMHASRGAGMIWSGAKQCKAKQSKAGGEWKAREEVR